MITPTIGRKIWFHPAINFDGACSDPSQPLDASIAYVHSPTLINISFADQNGKMYNATSVRLWDGEGQPPSSYYCEWMPYQVNQAKAR
jgi:hypothetical protein